MPRNGFVEGVPDTLLPAVFRMNPAELQVIEGPGFVGLVRLDSIQPVATDTPDAIAARKALSLQAQQALAQDALELFTLSLTAEAGITLNDAAIAAVNAQVR
jgi:peptidyl-prolyl cis-trans isomerase D